MKQLFLLILILTLAVGCGTKKPTEPAGVVEITTDQSAYTLGDTIVVSIVNGLNHSVYVSFCPGPVVDKRIDGAWVVQHEYSTLCLDGYIEPVEIKAGESQTDRFSRTITDSGTYRFREGFWDGTLDSPQRAAYSRPFEIK